MSGTQDGQENKDGQENEVVDKKAYLKVSEDMHKYKNGVKALQAEIDKIKADKEAEDKQKLIEQNKWSELYKKSEAVIQMKDKELEDTKNKFANFHKLNSVLQAVGGFKKSEYNRFVNLDTVVLNSDGSVNEESIKLEAERVRKEYSELLKTTEVKEPVSKAAQSGTSIGTDVSKMSKAELEAYKQSLYKDIK